MHVVFSAWEAFKEKREAERQKQIAAGEIKVERPATPPSENVAGDQYILLSFVGQLRFSLL